jgi:ABC-type transport system involved in cytochrome c biogenesis permease subunit
MTAVLEEAGSKSDPGIEIHGGAFAASMKAEKTGEATRPLEANMSPMANLSSKVLIACAIIATVFALVQSTQVAATFVLWAAMLIGFGAIVTYTVTQFSSH